MDEGTSKLNIEGERDSSDFAAAMLLEKIVRDTYPARGSREIQQLQWSIIRYIAGNPEHRCTMSWIRRFLNLTHAPVVRAIDALVAKGLIRQLPNPDDARSQILQLSELGFAEAENDPLFAIANRIRRLPAAERTQLRRMLRDIAMMPDEEEG